MPGDKWIKFTSIIFCFTLFFFADHTWASVINLPGQVKQLEYINSVGAGAYLFDTFDYQAFDPSLGELDHVTVSMNGVLNGQIQDLSGNLIGRAYDGTPIYGPTTYTAGMNFSIASLVSGFEFDNPAVTYVSGVATGLPGSLTSFVTTYEISFDFDSLTDFAGFTPPDSHDFTIPPLPGISGMRDDFNASSIYSGTIFQALNIDLDFLPTPSLSTLNVLSMNNALIFEIDYFYTPYTDPSYGPEPGVEPPPLIDPESVPEPGSLSLFLLGLLSLFKCRRRQVQEQGTKVDRTGFPRLRHGRFKGDRH